jgi:general stress protein 26
MQPEITDYLATEQVGVLAVEMLDGGPHAATVHFAHAPGSLVLYFETYFESRKAEPLFGREATRASFVVGSDARAMKTLQLDGTVSLVTPEEKEAYAAVYFGKFPGKIEKSKDPKFTSFKFVPTWWRFTDWTLPSGKLVLVSGESIPEFGLKRENEERRDGGCAIVFDPERQQYAVGRHDADGLFRLFSGGVDENEDVKEGVLREVVEESGLHDFAYVEKTAEAMSHYRNNLRNVDRVAKATCFLVVLGSVELVPVQLEEHEKFSLAFATAEEILRNWETRNENKDYDHWIYFLRKSVARAVALGYDTTTRL